MAKLILRKITNIGGIQMEIKNIGKEKFHELIVGDHFRVCNKAFIVSVDDDYIYIKHSAISEGLNIEQSFVGTDGKKSYVVILSVDWDDENKQIITREDADDLMNVIRDLNNTISDEITFREIIEELINSYDFAVQTLKDIHEVK